MTIEWTPQAIYAWEQISEYIFDKFGFETMVEFEEATNEEEERLLNFPRSGQKELSAWNKSVEYRYTVINGLTKMIYHIEEEKIIVDLCWDTRVDCRMLIQKL
jgi:plasmid stabilization system protein ParE